MAVKRTTLNVAVLGRGPISQYGHFEACRRARNARLYAICDVAEDLLNRMAEIHQPLKPTMIMTRCWPIPRWRLSSLASRINFMWKPLKPLQRGKHVLVEKPLGVSVEECEELRRRPGLPDVLSKSEI